MLGHARSTPPLQVALPVFRHPVRQHGSRELAAAGAFAQAGNPAPMAREGAFEQLLCFGGPAHLVNASDTDRYGTYQTTGGTQSTIKAFDSMSLECIGAFELRSGAYRHKGYCFFQDASGWAR